MDASPLPLDSVVANEELSRRRPRHRMQDALDHALGTLAAELATSPRRVLQKLTDAALELCQAHSAGVSLVEAEGERQFFRWHAVSGRWAPLLWTTLPREFSPCGTVLERKAAQLMILPERHFTPLAQVPPKVYEALLVPFEVAGELVGTVWVVSHDAERRFDSEDRRVVAGLARFAAQAYERLSSLSAEDVVQLTRMAGIVGAHRGPNATRAVVQKRILIVDDNADSADTLALLLRTMGHEVHVARDGRTALAALPRARPEIVLLDIVMPDLSGYEVAKRIRDRLGAGVRIVALTGFGSDEDRQRALESGFDQHLIKPVDPAFLKSLLG
jgi:CheY-like chemotaxis protein